MKTLKTIAGWLVALTFVATFLSMALGVVRQCTELHEFRKGSIMNGKGMFGRP
jgi:hypothetical protein